MGGIAHMSACPTHNNKTWEACLHTQDMAGKGGTLQCADTAAGFHINVGAGGERGGAGRGGRDGLG
eukprot:364810-Chlamydomonas_euryale.AAC.4